MYNKSRHNIFFEIRPFSKLYISFTYKKQTHKAFLVMIFLKLYNEHNLLYILYTAESKLCQVTPIGWIGEHFIVLSDRITIITIW